MSEWLGACLQNKLREFESHLDVSYFNLIYFLNKEEIYGGSVDSFLIAINNNLNLKFSRNIYSYSE